MNEIARCDAPFSGTNRPKTRNDLIERLMRYDWGRQLDILSYMKRFETWDMLYADLDRMAAEHQSADTQARYLGIDVASGSDTTVIVMRSRVYGLAGDVVYTRDVEPLSSDSPMRNVTPAKPKQIEEKK